MNNLYGVDLDMYRALKNLRTIIVEMQEREGTQYISPGEMAESLEAMDNYEKSLGPLPVWAKAWNFERDFVQSAQLFTKNGRVCGNGVIAYVEVPPKRDLKVGEKLPLTYCVITDAGNSMMLSQGELQAGFEVGDFLFTDRHIEQMQLRFQPS